MAPDSVLSNRVESRRYALDRGWFVPVEVFAGRGFTPGVHRFDERPAVRTAQCTRQYLAIAYATTYSAVWSSSRQRRFSLYSAAMSISILYKLILHRTVCTMLLATYKHRLMLINRKPAHIAIKRTVSIVSRQGFRMCGNDLSKQHRFWRKPLSETQIATSR